MALWHDPRNGFRFVVPPPVVRPHAFLARNLDTRVCDSELPKRSLAHALRASPNGGRAIGAVPSPAMPYIPTSRIELTTEGTHRSLLSSEGVQRVGSQGLRVLEICQSARTGRKRDSRLLNHCGVKMRCSSPRARRRRTPDGSPTTRSFSSCTDHAGAADCCRRRDVPHRRRQVQSPSREPRGRRLRCR